MKLTPIAQAMGATVPRRVIAVCRHPDLMARVTFNPEAAKGLSASEVRQRWPRLVAACPACRETVICYASTEHYIAGDW